MFLQELPHPQLSIITNSPNKLIYFGDERMIHRVLLTQKSHLLTPLLFETSFPRCAHPTPLLLHLIAEPVPFSRYLPPSPRPSLIISTRNSPSTKALSPIEAPPSHHAAHQGILPPLPIETPPQCPVHSPTHPVPGLKLGHSGLTRCSNCCN